MNWDDECNLTVFLNSMGPIDSFRHPMKESSRGSCVSSISMVCLLLWEEPFTHPASISTRQNRTLSLEAMGLFHDFVNEPRDIFRSVIRENCLLLSHFLMTFFNNLISGGRIRRCRKKNKHAMHWQSIYSSESQRWMELPLGIFCFTVVSASFPSLAAFCRPLCEVSLPSLPLFIHFSMTAANTTFYSLHLTPTEDVGPHKYSISMPTTFSWFLPLSL